MIFEIGTFRGRTTLNMAINSPIDTKVYTLDLPYEFAENTRLPLDSTSLYLEGGDVGERKIRLPF